MIDPVWDGLVESVLGNVEANPAERARIKERLREQGCLSTLHSMWSTGLDPSEVARQLRRQAMDMK